MRLSSCSPALDSYTSLLAYSLTCALPRPLAVVSPYRQAPMRGAVQHWVTRGYKRLAQQAMYFAIPIGAGPSSPPPYPLAPAPEDPRISY